MIKGEIPKIVKAADTEIILNSTAKWNRAANDPKNAAIRTPNTIFSKSFFKSFLFILCLLIKEKTFINTKTPPFKGNCFYASKGQVNTTIHHFGVLVDTGNVSDSFSRC